MAFQGFGLNKTPKDDRDFPFGAIGGFADIKSLTKEYSVSKPLIIKDQGNSDMCTAYALTAVSEDQEGVVLDPFFTFGHTKKIQGNPDSWGADLRSAIKSATKVGFLQAFPPGKVSIPPSGQDREDAARLIGFGKEDEDKAAFHKKLSYFSINGPYDTFDNFRSALWQQREEERSIFTGALWRLRWSREPSGVIDVLGPANGFGHAVKIFGWDGEYLTAQLSNGTNFGQEGIFRLSREVVNGAFTYGGFTFMDLPREQAEFEIQRKAKKKPGGILGSMLSYWIKSIFS